MISALNYKFSTKCSCDNVSFMMFSLLGDTQVTISEVLPILAIIKKRMTRNTECVSELTKTLMQDIQDYLSGENVYDNLAIATFLQKASFLDPRYKKFSGSVKGNLLDEAKSHFEHDKHSFFCFIWDFLYLFFIFDTHFWSNSSLHTLLHLFYYCSTFWMLHL